MKRIEIKYVLYDTDMEGNEIEEFADVYVLNVTDYKAGRIQEDLKYFVSEKEDK